MQTEHLRQCCHGHLEVGGRFRLPFMGQKSVRLGPCLQGVYIVMDTDECNVRNTLWSVLRLLLYSKFRSLVGQFWYLSGRRRWFLSYNLFTQYVLVEVPSMCQGMF